MLLLMCVDVPECPQISSASSVWIHQGSKNSSQHRKGEIKNGCCLELYMQQISFQCRKEWKSFKFGRADFIPALVQGDRK